MEKKAIEVVAALIWDGGRFLICQRPAHKARGLLWEFVGGKVEPGETKEQALVRECREELAVTISKDNFTEKIRICSVRFLFEYLHNISFFVGYLQIIYSFYLTVFPICDIYNLY